MSKRAANIITQKEGFEKIKDKQFKDKALKKKSEIENVKKIVEQGNKIQKILGQTPYKQNKRKKNNHYYQDLSENTHHFEEKI